MEKNIFIDMMQEHRRLLWEVVSGKHPVRPLSEEEKQRMEELFAEINDFLKDSIIPE